MQPAAEPVSAVHLYNHEVQSLSAAAEKRGWRSLPEDCLMHWHLCSLDAPTVAVVWATTLAHLGGVRPRAAQLAVLGLGTWIVYVLDRVLDGVSGLQGSRGAERLRARHHFHHRHRRLLLWLCLLAAALLALLCLQLSGRLVAIYLLLAVPVAAYGLRVHRRMLWPLTCNRVTARGRGRKEAAVAVLFVAAVAAPALAASPAVYLPLVVAATLLLAPLCWLNCSLISYAESARGLQGPHAKRQLVVFALALGVVAAGISLWERGRLADGRSFFLPGEGLPAGAWTPAAAVALSCLLLLTLLMVVRDPGADARRVRVLADLGLLTPLLFLLPRL